MVPTALNQPAQDPIRLVLFDDQGLFRSGLAKLLAAEGSFEVVAECGTSAEALEILHHSPVDVVLLGLDFGPAQANDFISAAAAAGYRGRFLIIAGGVDAHHSAMALKLGASGIFLKSEDPERLVQAIRVVATGAVWIDEKIVRLLADRCLHQPRLVDQRSGGTLEDRERKVLQGILDGLTNSKIADRMGISESSVKNTLQSLFSRTGVRTRSQLVRLALEGALGSLIEGAQAQSGVV